MDVSGPWKFADDPPTPQDTPLLAAVPDLIARFATSADFPPPPSTDILPV